MNSNTKKLSFLFILCALNTTIKSAMLKKHDKVSSQYYNASNPQYYTNNDPNPQYSSQILNPVNNGENPSLQIPDLSTGQIVLTGNDIQNLEIQIEGLVGDDPDLKRFYDEIQAKNNKQLVQYAQKIEKMKKIKELEEKRMELARAKLERNQEKSRLQVTGGVTGLIATGSLVSLAKKEVTRRMAKETTKRAAAEMTKSFFLSTVQTTIIKGEVVVTLTPVGGLLSGMCIVISLLLIARGIYNYHTKDLDYYKALVKRKEEEEKENNT